MNKVILTGRTTEDIELKTTPNGKSNVAFTIAVRRATKDNIADFFRCVAWGVTAEILSKYVKKGNKIGIEGRLCSRSYEKDGKKVFVTEIMVESIEFLEKKDVSVTFEKDETSNEDLPF